eukprot:TRINITY_DN17644_c0_g2_i2.p2 TRINITY_DN17644_c0_g2~~TRINITY_DN17644_c0_g2_i2.p2  ORF type:complete len:200 (-),score=-14.72 TRINITY_DN17644_c0_g2_i2:215-814(-)
MTLILYFLCFFSYTSQNIIINGKFNIPETVSLFEQLRNGGFILHIFVCVFVQGVLTRIQNYYQYQQQHIWFIKGFFNEYNTVKHLFLDILQFRINFDLDVFVCFFGWSNVTTNILYLVHFTLQYFNLQKHHDWLLSEFKCFLVFMYLLIYVFYLNQFNFFINCTKLIQNVCSISYIQYVQQKLHTLCVTDLSIILNKVL